MSFVPGFAPDARSQWRELPPLLQELVLDEMERLAANPPRGESFNFDIAHAGEGGVDYVFLNATTDCRRSKITVTGVNHYFRQGPP